jgi:multidrug efflux pump subunit AcrA (membrane-fusion protein)
MTTPASRAAFLRDRRIVAAAGAVLAIAIVLLLVLPHGRGDDAAPRGQARPASGDTAGGMAGMHGMNGMPGMGMSSDGSVRLSADQIRQFGITFGTVEQRPLSAEVRTAGTVTADETRIAQVTPKFGGFVERLYVDFTGQPVQRGQPLLEIYSPELVAAQQELLVAARLQRTVGESSVPGVPAPAMDLVAAARERLRLWDVPDAQIREVLRTGRVRRTVTLFSPASGVVTEKQVVRGQAVQAGQPLYTIADLSRVWVQAELREADAGTVREGSPATVELAAFPGRPLAGVVSYLQPVLQEQARTLRARIVLANPDGRIRPGMYATVRLSAPERTALTVPVSALVRTGERTLVFVDLGGGRLQPQEVETGRVAGDAAEVLSGLEPGQRVVTSAQFLLDSESNLGEVMRSMIGQTGSGDMGAMQMGAPADTAMKGAEMRGMKLPPERR